MTHSGFEKSPQPDAGAGITAAASAATAATAALLYDETLVDATLGCLPELRRRLRRWLTEEAEADRAAADRFLLSVTEIVSNLLIHPPKPPLHIHIGLRKNSDGSLQADVADDSASFAAFAEKKQLSLQRIGQHSLAEGGRGLALITLQHPQHRYVPAGASPDRLNHFVLYDAHESHKRGGKNARHARLPGSSPASAPAHQKPVIFIIDDDEAVRDLLALITRKEYAPHLFANARDALSAFDALQPEIIISDFMMPGMNGADLRRALAQHKGGDTTPFIFLSGRKDIAEDRDIASMGIDDFLTKPIDRGQLIRVCDRLLVRSRQLKQRIESQTAQKIDGQITAALAPRLPQRMGSWNAAVISRAAGTGGSDFLFYETGENGHALVLADVMGHDTGAKFFAYAYAGYLRSQWLCLPHRDNPGLLLGALSRMAGEDSFLSGCGLTCLAAWLDDSPAGAKKTGKGETTVRLAAAAHPPPLHLRAADGGVSIINVSGPLPGIPGNHDYGTYSALLQPDDILLLHTDGLTGKQANGAMLREGIAGLAHRGHPRKDGDALQNLAEAVMNLACETQDDSSPDDDATLVLLQFSPEQELKPQPEPHMEPENRS